MFSAVFKEIRFCMQKASFSSVPTIALTATATEKVKQDIQQSLQIQNCSHFQVSSQQRHRVLPCACMHIFIDRLWHGPLGFTDCKTHGRGLHQRREWFANDLQLQVQVSFFRPNLTFKVVLKGNGTAPNGKPASLEALVNFIR